MKRKTIKARVVSNASRARKRGRPVMVDEFSDLPVSRQRKWQLRQMARGGCVLCGEPAISGHKCLRHMIQTRESAAHKNGFKNQYHSKSRILEELYRQLPAKWDYKLVSAREAGVLSDPQSQHKFINEHGQAGWDLTAAMREPGGDIWFYFKRPETSSLDALLSQATTSLNVAA